MIILNYSIFNHVQGVNLFFFSVLVSFCLESLTHFVTVELNNRITCSIYLWHYWTMFSLWLQYHIVCLFTMCVLFYKGGGGDVGCELWEHHCHHTGHHLCVWCQRQHAHLQPPELYGHHSGKHAEWGPRHLHSQHHHVCQRYWSGESSIRCNCHISNTWIQRETGVFRELYMKNKYIWWKYITVNKRGYVLMSNGVVIPNKCKYDSLRQQMCLMLLFFFKYTWN